MLLVHKKQEYLRGYVKLTVKQPSKRKLVIEIQTETRNKIEKIMIGAIKKAAEKNPATFFVQCFRAACAIDETNR